MDENFIDASAIFKRISVCVEKRECLYDKNHKYHKIPKAREDAYKHIASEINSDSNLNVQLCWMDVKKRWENIRKYFVKKLKINSKHFLYDELRFLIPHLKRDVGCTLHESNKLYKNVGTLLNGDNDSTLQYNDILKAINQPSTSKSLLVQAQSSQTQMEKHATDEPEVSNKTSKIALQTQKEKLVTNKPEASNRISICSTNKQPKKIVPEIDLKANYKKDRLNTLEEKNMKIAESVLASVQDLIKDSTSNDEYDDYLMSIYQSLLYIPEEHLL